VPFAPQANSETTRMDSNAATPPTDAPHGAAAGRVKDYFRFHRSLLHLSGPFGPGGFGQAAEAFARYFGTPGFLIGQSVLVAAWIAANVLGIVHFDLYPFILLNLAFSLQAAYAAPLILLAQTRQADRDKAHADADAQHREELACANRDRQDIAARQADRLRELLEANTALTEQIKQVAARIDTLTREIHGRVVASAG
jgi:uncharacterized membrane protein